MNALIRGHYEKLVLAGVVVALVSGGVWLRSEFVVLRMRFDGTTGVALNLREFHPPVLVNQAPQATLWPEPKTQSRGADWRYELFSPPDLTLDGEQRAYVIRSAAETPKSSLSQATSPELLEIIAEPFRVQLVGSIGEEGDRQVILVNMLTNETLLARSDQHFEELALSVKSVSLAKVVVREDEFGPVHEMVTSALLFDAQNGDEVLLTSGVKRLTGRLRAVLRVEEKRLEMAEGTVFRAGDWVCRVERILMNRDEVVISRTKPGLVAAETWVLHPRNGFSTGQKPEPVASPDLQSRIATRLP